MAETTDLPARLRAACVGHPVASIAWPHRLLHEAADEIERLRLEVLNAAGAAMCAGLRAMAEMDDDG